MREYRVERGLKLRERSRLMRNLDTLVSYRALLLPQRLSRLPIREHTSYVSKSHTLYVRIRQNMSGCVRIRYACVSC